MLRSDQCLDQVRIEETAKLEQERKLNQDRQMQLRASLIEEENSAAREVAELKKQVEEAKSMIDAPSPSLSPQHDQDLAALRDMLHQDNGNSKAELLRLSISSTTGTSISQESCKHFQRKPGNLGSVIGSAFSFSDSSRSEALTRNMDQVLEEIRFDEIEPESASTSSSTNSTAGAANRATFPVLSSSSQAEASQFELQDGRVVWSITSKEQSGCRVLHDSKEIFAGIPRSPSLLSFEDSYAKSSHKLSTNPEENSITQR